MSLHSLFAGEVTDLQAPAAWLVDLVGGRKTASGEHVNQSSAMALTAYAGIIIGVSQDIGKVPWQVRERRVRPRRGSDHAWDHPLQSLLKKPNAVQTSMQFRQVMQHYLMGFGNAYAEIERNKHEQIVGLWPVHPSRFTPRWTSDAKGVEYVWTNDAGRAVTLDSREVFHLKALGGGIKGYSILGFVREAIGLGLAAQRNAAAVFGEGLAKRMVAFVKETMSKESRKGLRRRIQGDKENDPVGYRKLPIVEGDVELKDAGITPEDAQALESREFTVEEVARVYRYALQKLQYSKRAQGWSTLDALEAQHVGDALLPWYVTWEEECWDKLLSEEEKHTLFFKFMVNGLLRGDFKTRTEGYARMFAIGGKSPNDIRELEDDNPITLPDGTDDPAGDQYFVQAGFVPIGEATRSTPDPLQPSTQVGAPDDEDAPDDASAFDARLAQAALVTQPVFDATALHLVERETSRLVAALKRHATNRERFDAWAIKAYADLAREGAEAFGPCALTLSSAAGVTLAPMRMFTYAPTPPKSGEADDIQGRAQRLAADIRDQVVASLREAHHAEQANR